MSRILMVASEASPFAKTGGLGDVLGALPAALARRGEDVAVVLPLYRAAKIGLHQRILFNVPLTMGPHQLFASVDEQIYDGVRYYFVDCPRLYDRAGIYGEGGVDYPDNHIRFGLLNLAALTIARTVFPARVFHAHDWQAGLLAAYLRTNFAGDPTFFGSKCVLTIHNLGYQGNFPRSSFGDLGLDPVHLHTEGIEFYGMVSFLKAGIVWSDAITTVSPTYAREIQTPAFGFGMDGLLRARSNLLTGILNGVDYGAWNPETDPYIPARYSADDLSGKLVSKLALLEEMGLPAGAQPPGSERAHAQRPVIGIVSRLVEQKGFDLIGGAMTELIEEDPAPEDFPAEDFTMVVLGSGEWRFEEMFRRLARSRPDRFAVRIGYDETLSHCIEAGSDMFLMPSRYEPCGLSQIYSLRYGTVPIVRATGGLEDTVDEETGFKFSDYSSTALAEAIRAALEAWRDPDSWRLRMRRGMAKEYSWEVSAEKYQKIYHS